MATTVLGGMLFSGFTILPTAVMSSAHRDAMLNERFEKLGITAKSETGGGSWVTPVTMNNVVFKDETGQVEVTIREVRTSRTISGLLMHGGDLGKITLVDPVIHIALDEDGRLPPKLRAGDRQGNRNDDSLWTGKDQPAFAVEVQNAEFVLSVPWRPVPIVELDNLNASLAVTNEDEGRFLQIDPVQLLDHEPLSELHTEQNLALIAPVLSQSTELAGDVSVRLEGVRARLDGADKPQIPIAGEAVFHSVEARLKKEWVTQISQLTGRIAGTSVPDRLEIVRDSLVAFQVDDRGIHHQGLVFLLPEIASNLNIESSGMVGLDESLDLALSVQFPQFATETPFLAAFSKLTRLPFHLSVVGTVSEPKLVSPPGFSMLDQMAQSVDPNASTQPPSVPAAVMDLIGSASNPDSGEATEGVVGGILNIIRSAKSAKENSDPKPPKVKRSRKNRERSQL